MNSTSMHRLSAPIAAAVLSSVLSSAAWGYTQWIGGDGGWNTNAKWTDGVPDATDVADLNTSGTVTVDADAQAYQLIVDKGQTVQQAANVLAVADVTFVGWSGAGSFTQSGGTHTVVFDLNLGQLPGSSGTYDLSGTGQVTLGRNLHIGLEGSGVFTQSGITQVNVTGGVLLPGNVSGTGSGTYDLQSGFVTSDYMVVGVAGTGNTVKQTGGTNTTGVLTVGGDGEGTYTLSAGGTLSVTGNAIVGQFDAGEFTQTGGTFSATALAVGYGDKGNGSFNLSDGTVTTDRTYVGLLANSTGTYNQTGGTHTVVGTGTGHEFSGTLTIARDAGSIGTYNLGANQTGGSLTAGWLDVGRAGTGGIAQSGGSVTVTNNLVLGRLDGSSGTYTVNDAGASVSANEIHVGAHGNGVFSHSAGDVSTKALVLGYNTSSPTEPGVGSGTYNLSGSAELSTTGSQRIGMGGMGIFNQSGGMNTVSANVVVGQSNGAKGTYYQTGGTNTVGGNLNLGQEAGGSGTYELSGSAILTVTGRENVGLRGNGVFTQAGGTNTVTDVLYIGRESTATGMYNLDGGTLNAENGIGNGIYNIADLTPGGTGTFNFTGGTLNITGGVFANAGQFIMSGTEPRIVNGDVTNITGGSLTGNGTITGNFLNDGGQIAPGFSPGQIDILGDFIFNSGVLEIEVAGLGADDFDVLKISGDAKFTGGTILFSFIDGFLPSEDDMLNFLVADTVSGLDLVALAYSGVAPGFKFKVTVGENGLIFTALNDAVPEPATLVLFAAGLAGLGAVRRRKLAA